MKTETDFTVPPKFNRLRKISLQSYKRQYTATTTNRKEHHHEKYSNTSPGFPSFDRSPIRCHDLPAPRLQLRTHTISNFRDPGAPRLLPPRLRDRIDRRLCSLQSGQSFRTCGRRRRKFPHLHCDLLHDKGQRHTNSSALSRSFFLHHRIGNHASVSEPVNFFLVTGQIMFRMGHRLPLSVLSQIAGKTLSCAISQTDLIPDISRPFRRNNFRKHRRLRRSLEVILCRIDIVRICCRSFFAWSSFYQKHANFYITMVLRYSLYICLLNYKLPMQLVP